MRIVAFAHYLNMRIESLKAASIKNVDGEAGPEEGIPPDLGKEGPAKFEKPAQEGQRASALCARTEAIPGRAPKAGVICSPSPAITTSTGGASSKT